MSLDGTAARTLIPNCCVGYLCPSITELSGCSPRGPQKPAPAQPTVLNLNVQNHPRRLPASSLGRSPPFFLLTVVSAEPSTTAWTWKPACRCPHRLLLSRVTFCPNFFQLTKSYFHECERLNFHVCDLSAQHLSP